MLTWLGWVRIRVKLKRTKTEEDLFLRVLVVIYKLRVLAKVGLLSSLKSKKEKGYAGSGLHDEPFR